MLLESLRRVLLVAAITGALSAQAVAQATLGEEIVDQFNAIFPIDKSREMTVSELCCRLDSLTEKLRNNGLVLVKQPDVFSQARMTRFRNDFENQMNSDLANFHLVLAARINRLDSATTTSATALGATLSAPGTTNVQAPSAGSNSAAASLLNPNSGLFPSYTQPNLFGSSVPGAFNSLAVGPNTLNLPQPSAANAAALSLGVEPTVYLDEKKRFLDYLNHLRRLNLGPDQNDSSGYGLYLVRLPVSITPGECTYQGHGADLSVQVEHEFTPGFLPSAFRRLVINDVVDQLGPFLYEVIRSGYYEKTMKPRYDSRQQRLSLSLELAELIAAQMKVLNKKPQQEVARELTNYILRTGSHRAGGPGTNLSGGKTSIQYRRDLVERYVHDRPSVAHVPPFTADSEELAYRPTTDLRLRTDVHVQQSVFADITALIAASSPLDDGSMNLRFREFLQGLYYDAIADDVERLDDLLGVAPNRGRRLPPRWPT